MNDIKSLVLASIISADNPDFTEDQKQEVIRRFDLAKSAKNFDDIDWEFVLEPVDNNGRLLKLFI